MCLKFPFYNKKQKTELGLRVTRYCFLARAPLYVNLHVNNVWNTRVFQAKHLGLPSKTPRCSKQNTLVFQAASIGDHQKLMEDVCNRLCGLSFYFLE